MLRMEIEFYTEKIKTDGIVTEKMLFDQIDKVVLDLGLIKVREGVYRDAGDKNDLTNFFSIISYLSKTKWFPRYVKRWDWYNDKSGIFKDVKPEDLRDIIYD